MPGQSFGFGFLSSLPLQFSLVVRSILALCFCRATDKEGWFDSSSGCFCMWVSHKCSLLEPEEVSKPWSGVNAQLKMWLYPCHFFSLLLMCRNSTRKMTQLSCGGSVFQWFVLLRAVQKLQSEFCLQTMWASCLFFWQVQEDTGHLFASSFLCESMVTSALLDIVCAVCRMLKHGFYDCCLSGNSKKIRYLSHEVHLVGKNI